MEGMHKLTEKQIKKQSIEWLHGATLKTLFHFEKQQIMIDPPKIETKYDPHINPNILKRRKAFLQPNGFIKINNNNDDFIVKRDNIMKNKFSDNVNKTWEKLTKEINKDLKYINMNGIDFKNGFMLKHALMTKPVKRTPRQMWFMCMSIFA